MATIFTIANHKGGVGKTTTAINLGAAFAEQGKRVLGIDFDPQGGLTAGLGYDPGSFETTMYHVLIKKAQLNQILLPTSIPQMDLAPSNLDLSGAEAELPGTLGFEKFLLRALQPLVQEYDTILIDCPPSLGILTINALVAAHIVIIPLQCEYLALKALKQLQHVLAMVIEEANPRLKTSILRTMFDKRTLHAKEISEEIEEIVQQRLIDAHILQTVIKRTVKLADAVVGSKSILAYAGQSDVAGAYRQLAKELNSYGPGIN